MNAPAPAVKYFTVVEANRTLPFVRVVVRDIMELFQDIERRRVRLASLRSMQGKRRAASDPYEEEVRQMVDELEADIERLQGFVLELQGIGAELKDPGQGLVDYRTRIEGREAYLCWKFGEEEISHWHELDAGFSGRQSLFAGAGGGGRPKGQSPQSN